MVDDNGKFTCFIDSENTLWGLALDSFGVIIERYTFDGTILREAFFEGYSLLNDAVIKEKMKILSVKWYLQIYTMSIHITILIF